MKKKVHIRQSILAGSWYPGSAEVLRRDIRTYLEAAQVHPIEGELKGLLVPHAGYLYSGGVAAYAYKILEKQSFQRVLILAPSHRAAFQGVSVGHLQGYETPLGVVPVDDELVELFHSRTSLVSHHPEAEALEHSLEIQLPFLQVVLDQFKLTPLIMGGHSLSLCQELASTIFELCREKGVLIVASTDLSHFHSYDEAKSLDSVVLDKVDKFDPEGLSRELSLKRCEACGGGPMVTAILAAGKLGADQARVLHYANSGDVTGDRSGVVGYMAGAMFKATPSSKSTKEETLLPASRRKGQTPGLGLSREEKETLRQLALQSMRSHCLETPDLSRPLITKGLEEHRGAFVSIHKGKELRGCIGVIESICPLHETVKKMAVQAAFNDPRFCALSSSELDAIDVEISVLSPLKKIDDVQEILMGTHGLYIHKEGQTGVLLPHVATQQGWDRTQLLEWTCRKAGLPPDAWKDSDAEICVFTAETF